MPNKAFHTSGGGAVLLECKSCGQMVRVFKASLNHTKYTCHQCHGHRFRRVQE